VSRNRNSEETVKRILEVSYRLFMEKGYEHASIQDIINHLGGLSKGAIYHHFKSKEDILVAVMERMTLKSNQMLADIRDCADLNGIEKLKAIFKASITRPVQDEIFATAPNFCDNPKLLVSILQDTINNVAPNYILPIINQGIADGSIQTDYPEQLAELIIFTANIWINPMVFKNSAEGSYRKIMLYQQMLQGFGLEILDQEMVERLQELVLIYQKQK